MSWIQENKFVAGLAGVTAVVGGAILFFGNSQGSAFDQKMTEYDGLRAEHANLEKSKPYPDAGNLKKRQGNIEKYETAIASVQTSLLGYQPGKLNPLTPEQFSDAQVKMEKDLRKAFEDAGTTLPPKCNFGFEKYASVQAKAMATPRLNFQMGAIQSLLTKLADTKPHVLLNVKRVALPVESGRVEAPRPAARARGGRPGKGAAAQARGAGAKDKPFQLMPVELAFTASEASVRDFLKEMVNSKEYFYAIRAIRIRNEKQTAPTVKDADFPNRGGRGAAPAAIDPFEGIGFPDADTGEDTGEDTPEGDDAAIPAPAAPAPVVEGERILKQVLGSERLHVYISFDILLIRNKAAVTSNRPKPARDRN